MEFRKLTVEELYYVPDMCLWGISPKQREAMKEHMENRLRWLEKMMPQGLDIIVALGLRGGKKGLIEYLPIEIAPEPVKGENSLYIDCIWVLSPFWKKGIAKGLIRRFLDEAREVGGATVLAYEGDKWFGYFDYMPASFFRKFGFKEVSRDETCVLLHLDMGAHKLPTLLPSKKQMTGERAKTTLDVFCNRQCPWCGWMVDNVKRNVMRARRKYSGLMLKVINTDSRDTIERFGLARGVSINGEPVIRRMASWKEIKLTLDRFLGAKAESRLRENV